MIGREGRNEGGREGGRGDRGIKLRVEGRERWKEGGRKIRRKRMRRERGRENGGRERKGRKGGIEECT